MQLIATRTLTRLPGAPTLTSTVTGPTTATLNWSGPIPTGISVIAGYRLKRASVLSGPYTTLYTGLNLTFNDTVASGTMFYTIEAFDQFGTGTVSAAVSVIYVGGAGSLQLLLSDDFQTNPVSVVPQTGPQDGQYVWNRADNFDLAQDSQPSYSQAHARVGNASCRGQLTLTKTPVNGVYTQWVLADPNNSSHRNELNTTGLQPWGPTGWDRQIHLLHEYWYGWSLYIPGPGDPEACPISAWPGYLILFQLHDIGLTGINPVFTIGLDAPAGQNAQVAGTALRTNWSVSSSSRTPVNPDGSPGPHTSKKYDLGDARPDFGHWSDWVFRYKPDYIQYTGPEPPTNCKGIIQLWKNGVLQPLLTSQGQINFPNAGIPIGQGTGTDIGPYCVPFFYYTAWAMHGGDPDLNAPPPADYPHRYVQYAGWWRMIEAFGNPQAAVDSTNFAYQAVKPPGNR